MNPTKKKAITSPLILALAVLATLVAALSGAPPSGAAAVLDPGRADAWAAPTGGTGPQAGEIPLGSFVGSAATRGPSRHGAATGLKYGPSCSVQCITGGVAYGRGPDVRLVVTTDTPAEIRILISGDGYLRQVESDPGQTRYEVTLGDLDPDTAYNAFVSAVDANGDMANRSGTFRSLQRNVETWITEAHVIEAPYGDEPFASEIWFEHERGPSAFNGPAEDGVVPLGVNILGEDDTDRYLMVAVELHQSEPVDNTPCEVSPDPDEPQAGQYECSQVQSAWFPDAGLLDLDDRPAGEPVNHYWIETQLELPGGDALPPGYGLPLRFTVPITVEVTWTLG